MKKIESFTPAQLFFIVFENDIQIQKLVKATFFDLLFRKVLTFEIKTQYSEIKGEDVEIIYLIKGPFYPLVELNNLENYFLIPFSNSSNLSISLKNYFDCISEEIPFELDLLKDFKQTEWFKDYFEKKWYSSNFKLKKKYKGLKQEILNELVEIQSVNSTVFIDFNVEDNFLFGRMFLLRRRLYEELLSTHEIYSFLNRRFDQYLVSLNPKQTRQTGWSDYYLGCSGCN